MNLFLIIGLKFKMAFSVLYQFQIRTTGTNLHVTIVIGQSDMERQQMKFVDRIIHFQGL